MSFIFICFYLFVFEFGNHSNVFLHQTLVSYYFPFSFNKRYVRLIKKPFLNKMNSLAYFEVSSIYHSRLDLDEITEVCYHG